MTNKEKAREITEETGYFGERNGDFEERYQACIKMAAWKEQQMIEWLDKNAWKYAKDHQEVNTDKMIEDFKQAMMEE